ncbi:flagellar hook-associated protein FlgL [Castellaniella sp. GW247-6E4]|uniref:flagellar hook-associated protein FlgL n=1 Tax=Castellaniella sp. GW247-6E4 TaxID=3140380 RepID=UPI003314BD1D
MRISTNLLFNTGLKTIGTQQADLMHLYQQIGSGQRMVTPADDPLAATQSINIAQSQSLNQRFAENRAVALRNLGTEEDALGSLTLLLQDVRTRVVEAGGGALSDADRGTLATALRGARDAMLAIANTTDGNGQYVFSGSQGLTRAYAEDGTYLGDTLQRQIQADQTRRIAGGDVGSDVFERAQPGTLAYSTRQLAAGGDGTAILGAPTVVDHTLGNADSRLEFKITFTSATTYDIVVTDHSPATGPVTETFTDQPFTPGATVLDLPRGDGNSPAAPTSSGTQVQISGVPAAGDVFTVTPMRHDQAFNLFDTLDKLVAALEAPTAGDASVQAGLGNMLNTAMQQLSSGYDNVLTVRSSIGARMNELEAMNDVGEQRKLGYAKDLQRLEDLDYYDATMKLNLRKMALEGASLAFQTIQGLSLFNIGGK